MKKKVLVAMSGGVDSSVVSFLLKEEGYEVVGITMCLGVKEGRGKPACCGRRAIEDAKRVCRKLKIPHYIMDFSKELEEKIMNKFVSEYLEGRTPNPCIDCNRYIKFGALLKRAISMGFDFLATGHYARIENEEPGAESGIRYVLKKGIDTQKDQSYVLYAMNQEQLGYTLMPLGNFTKGQVRQVARDAGLPVADKPESQEICFIPENNYGEFLKEYVSGGAGPGPIVNKRGEILGEHRGIIFYTVGQRKRIGIAAREPLYVIAIDRENNTIVVSRKEDVYGDELIADNVNFIHIEKLKEPIRVEAKIRYLHQPQAAVVVPDGNGKIKVKFDRPQWAITPGQAVVFYGKSFGRRPVSCQRAGGESDADAVLGGGTIISGNSE
ncbi:MAG: tRNA 2-thiouridine(34) synthase MnmA [Candidatus Omnitrophota bacterium]